MLVLLILVITAVGSAMADNVTLVISAPGETAARLAAPVSMKIELKKHFGAGAEGVRLRLVELIGPEWKTGNPISVQFVSDPIDQADVKPTGQDASTGTLWWLNVRPACAGIGSVPIRQRQRTVRRLADQNEVRRTGV